MDASAVVEYLTGASGGGAIAERLFDHEFDVHIPHLCIVETASVLRGLVRGAKLSDERAENALFDLMSMPAVRHSHEPYLARSWELRHNLSSYDAIYVALAEALGATLVTCDQRLARTSLTPVAIEVIARPSEN